MAIDRIFGNRTRGIERAAARPKPSADEVSRDQDPRPIGGAADPAPPPEISDSEISGEERPFRLPRDLAFDHDVTDLAPAAPPDDPEERVRPVAEESPSDPWRAPEVEEVDEVEEAEPEMPRFRLSVTNPALSRSTGEEADLEAVSRAIREAFTPTQPKKHCNRSFAGRYEILERIIAAIEEQRAHIVVFGERGRGKTSLANVLTEIANEAGYFVLRCACSSDLSFEEMFRTFLRKLPRRYLDSGPRALAQHRTDAESFEELLPPQAFGATELTDALRYLTGGNVIFVIDEYDRVSEESLKNKLAETIKNLSDAGANVTLFVIGVARSLDELMGMHPSIQRNVLSIHLPLISPSEIRRIIRAGEGSSGTEFADEVRAGIVRLSKGLPYFAQLLCLHAARHAIEGGRTLIEMVDLRYAVDRAIQEADNTFRLSFEQAVRGDSGVTRKALFAAADCEADEFGSFTVHDTARVLERLERQEPHILTLRHALSMLTTPDRGAVLEKIVSPKGTQYRFDNHAMRQYVMAQMARERGLI